MPSQAIQNEISELPQRPDDTVLSDSIPLFFIGRNQVGFWVAREAEGRSGGLFLLKRSAFRFTRKKSETTGCATMLLTETFELDIENQGSLFVVPLAAVIDIAARRAPTLVAFIRMALAEWRKRVMQVTHALAGERRNREAIEKDLFHGHYILSSKNDDDLPIFP